MSEKQYFYLDYNNKKSGPYTISEIKDLGLLAEILVWKEGMADWQAIDTLPEFASHYPNKQSANNAKANKGPSAKVMLMRFLGIVLGFFGVVMLISLFSEFDFVALIIGIVLIALTILIFKKNKTNYRMTDADKGSHAGTMMGNFMNMDD